MRVKSARRIPSSPDNVQLLGAESTPRSTVSPRDASMTAKRSPLAPTTTAILGAAGRKPIWLIRIAPDAAPCPAATPALYASESPASDNVQIPRLAALARDDSTLGAGV